MAKKPSVQDFLTIEAQAEEECDADISGKGESIGNCQWNYHQDQGSGICPWSGYGWCPWRSDDTIIYPVMEGQNNNNNSKY